MKKHCFLHEVSIFKIATVNPPPFMYLVGHVCARALSKNAFLSIHECSKINSEVMT